MARAAPRPAVGVTAGLRLLVALAAALAPARAAALLARLHLPGGAEALRHAEELARAPRRARLAALAAAISAAAPAPAPRPAEERPAHPLLRRLRRERGAAGRTAARDAAGPPAGPAPDPGRLEAARTVNTASPVALPFELPQVSLGFARLDATARATGTAAAAAAARALAEVLGVEVALSGSARPVDPAPARPRLRLAVELGALPGAAWLEVEPALVARLVALVAGDPEPVPGAAALTPLEESALELLALAAIDGAASLDAVAERLAPRLVREAPPPPSPLAVDLELTAGGVRGRARLLLPAAAVAALAGPPGLAEPLLAFPLFASLRFGTAPLLPGELRALAPGDVVLADPPPSGRHRLVFPGGFTVAGTLAGGSLLVEETSMENPLAQVPILVDVELARVPLTLSDVARLTPGATLPVQLDRRGLVTLRVGERPLGRGELVEIDGAVGVRVLSLEVAP